MKILALSGSLRANSINSALLRAAARLAPVEVRVTVYRGLGNLPLFNPDVEDQPIEAVTNCHVQVANADALLIEEGMVSTPSVAAPIREALVALSEAVVRAAEQQQEP